MGPIWDAELRVWDAKNFGPVSPGTHRNKFVKKSLGPMAKMFLNLEHFSLSVLNKILVKLGLEFTKCLSEYRSKKEKT